MKTTAIAFAFAAFLIFPSLKAQDNLGIAGSNYSPANTVLVNPSSIVDNKAFIDINLVGVGVFAQNNLVSMNGSLIRLYRASSNSIAIEEPDFHLGKKSYYALADVNVHGPSATFQVKRWGFGIYTGIRSVTDARRITPELANYAVNGLQYAEQFGKEYDIRNLRFNTLTWGEVGVTAGTIVKQRGTELITAGITVKRLFGIMGGSMHLDKWNYMVVDSSEMVTYDVSGRYGFNEPGWASGKGWSADIGFTYKKTLEDVTGYVPHSKKSNCTTCDYKYKISMALLDVGRIKFKNPYFYQEFNEGTYNWEDYDQFDPEDSGELNSAISDEFNLADQQSKFKMWLPTALSAQVDFNLGKNFFLNATYIGGVPWIKSLGPQRGAQIGVTPRFELKRIEVAVPFVLHEYRRPHIGAMIRLNSIIIGTDNLGAYLLNQDVYGADIYFSIKYTIFKNFKCRTKRSRSQSKKKGAMPCWEG
ncbi:MAG: hypothetical protein ACI84C_001390 [Flavobacteriales bacterium]|jgi:hypothetical protein